MERCNCNTGRRGPHLLVIEVSLNLLGVLAGLPHHGTSGTPDGGGGTTNPADALEKREDLLLVGGGRLEDETKPDAPLRLTRATNVQHGSRNWKM